MDANQRKFIAANELNLRREKFKILSKRIEERPKERGGTIVHYEVQKKYKGKLRNKKFSICPSSTKKYVQENLTHFFFGTP